MMENKLDAVSRDVGFGELRDRLDMKISRLGLNQLQEGDGSLIDLQDDDNEDQEDKIVLLRHEMPVNPWTVENLVAQVKGSEEGSEVVVDFLPVRHLLQQVAGWLSQGEMKQIDLTLIKFKKRGRPQLSDCDGRWAISEIDTKGEEIPAVLSEIQQCKEPTAKNMIIESQKNKNQIEVKQKIQNKMKNGKNQRKLCIGKGENVGGIYGSESGQNVIFQLVVLRDKAITINVGCAKFDDSDDEYRQRYTKLKLSCAQLLRNALEQFQKGLCFKERQLSDTLQEQQQEHLKKLEEFRQWNNQIWKKEIKERRLESNEEAEKMKKEQQELVRKGVRIREHGLMNKKQTSNLAVNEGNKYQVDQQQNNSEIEEEIENEGEFSCVEVIDNDTVSEEESEQIFYGENEVYYQQQQREIIEIDSMQCMNAHSKQTRRVNYGLSNIQKVKQQIKKDISRKKREQIQAFGNEEKDQNFVVDANRSKEQIRVEDFVKVSDWHYRFDQLGGGGIEQYMERGEILTQWGRPVLVGVILEWLHEIPQVKDVVVDYPMVKISKQGLTEQVKNSNGDECFGVKELSCFDLDEGSKPLGDEYSRQFYACYGELEALLRHEKSIEAIQGTINAFLGDLVYTGCWCGGENYHTEEEHHHHNIIERQQLQVQINDRSKGHAGEYDNEQQFGEENKQSYKYYSDLLRDCRVQSEELKIKVEKLREKRNLIKCLCGRMYWNYLGNRIQKLKKSGLNKYIELKVKYQKKKKIFQSMERRQKEKSIRESNKQAAELTMKNQQQQKLDLKLLQHY